jgi:ribonucleoside-diphosphate reductase beta chain
LIGLNETTLQGYIEWLVDSRLDALGFDKIYNAKKNPIKGWSDAFMNSEAVQVAPQESEITSYKIGASKNDLDDLSFDDLSL